MHHRSTGLISVLLLAYYSLSLTSRTNGLRPFVVLESVPNFRPVVEGRLYRAASLDSLSVPDAQHLLEHPLTVIDLRNADEIHKGSTKRTEGAHLFYSSLQQEQQLVHVPILENVDAFWDEAIGRMEPSARAAATLQTIFSNGGALDRAAARHLEQHGPSLLYTVLLPTAQERLVQALEACCCCDDKDNTVIFHCQKGKDRTGVLAMLLQHCLGASDDEIIQAYAVSGDLLGGQDSSSSRDDNVDEKQKSVESSSMIDWSHFRGSPPSAMVKTLEWTKSPGIEHSIPEWFVPGRPD